MAAACEIAEAHTKKDFDVLSFQSLPWALLSNNSILSQATNR